MKTKLFLALSALLTITTLFVTSCEKNDPVKPKPPITIGAEFTNFTLEGDAIIKEVKFTATTDWAITLEETTKATPSWLELSAESGKAGEITLKFDIAENSTDKDRCAIATIAADGEKYPITVKQKFKEAAAPTQFSVTFDANGGTGTMAKQTANQDATEALTANDFARTGFTFTGWNTAADGSGESYANQADFDFEADATLYAQWEEDTTTPKIGFPEDAATIVRIPLGDYIIEQEITEPSEVYDQNSMDQLENEAKFFIGYNKTGSVNDFSVRYTVFKDATWTMSSNGDDIVGKITNTEGVIRISDITMPAAGTSVTVTFTAIAPNNETLSFDVKF